MKKIKQEIMRTGEDRHGDIIDKKLLKRIIQQVKRKDMLSHIEHDFRNPPIGKTINASLKRIKDGSYIVRGEFCLFEENDIEQIEISKKEIARKIAKENILEISVDRNFIIDNEINELVNKLDSTISANHEIHFEWKKSLEFSPELIFNILCFFPIVQISSGFFTQIGVEGFECLKNIIKKFKEKKVSDFQVHFKIDVKMIGNGKEEYIECLVIFTDPNENLLENLLLKAFESLEEKLKNDLFISKKPVSKIVYNVMGNKIKFEYTLRPDGVPLEVANRDEYIRILNFIAKNLLK
ncbi:hypothetical protein OCK72_04240 [Fusobacterium simiae]|uniref:Uncharacterized protein n=1 Tax=Fusobacterium simiae TaxID=855 RepID=A0ABT4DGX2_FUSSI|nr:hypothetical protein [Fusobacterium simiae]MCY7007865.1 hypothetical protein [Fusobacterium simiae]